MTEEEWFTSGNAPEMLSCLRLQRPDFFASQVSQIHRFLIACCWKHQHLIPQKGLRDGLRAAESWIAGNIDYEQLNSANWYAEADAFALDYASSPAEISEVERLIAGIKQLRSLPFAEARKVLLDAAYFAEGTMIYPLLSGCPWSQRLFTSRFLCPVLLRKYVEPARLQ
jgi:hypothetical protein